jgi:hypothetical protein
VISNSRLRARVHEPQTTFNIYSHHHELSLEECYQEGGEAVGIAESVDQLNETLKELVHKIRECKQLMGRVTARAVILSSNLMCLKR